MEGRAVDMVALQQRRLGSAATGGKAQTWVVFHGISVAVLFFTIVSM